MHARILTVNLHFSSSKNVTMLISIRHVNIELTQNVELSNRGREARKTDSI